MDIKFDYFTCYILFEYTEGHHDPPLVTLFVVTKLDFCCYDPDGMSFDIIINSNDERYEKSKFNQKVTNLIILHVIYYLNMLKDTMIRHLSLCL